MIKFAATDTNTNTPVLGIGLSRENCDRLLDGQPIQFNTAGMDGLPSLIVFVMAGETEESMAIDMVRGGAVRPDKIREDRTLRDNHVHPVDKGATN